MDVANSPKKSPDKSLVWLIIILTIALIVAVVWWWNYRKYITTDDANLDSYRVNVAARVMAPIAALHVQEGDTVKQGDLLAELDSSSLNTTQRETIARQEESGYYRIVAPTGGVIAKRWLVPGDIVQPGQTIFTLNQGKEIWVSAYLEETKFQNIYIGQAVQFTLDAYNGLTFHGKIFYIGSNTASEFALIPPNNASGNYTKVAQRIPLKISIDRVEGTEKEKAKVKLISGLSAHVEIIKKNP